MPRNVGTPGWIVPLVWVAVVAILYAGGAISGVLALILGSLVVTYGNRPGRLLPVLPTYQVVDLPGPGSRRLPPHFPTEHSRSAK